MSNTSWRCFHCDEILTTEPAAIEHFGSTERQVPACRIDIAAYRAMEQRIRVYEKEDMSAHKGSQAVYSNHELEIMRADERGYARGLRDAKRQAEWEATMKPSEDRSMMKAHGSGM